MAKVRTPKDEQERDAREKIQKRIKSLFSGQEPPAHLNMRQVEALKARIAELEAKLTQQPSAALQKITMPARESDSQPVPEAKEFSSNALRITRIGLPASIIAASFYLYLALTIGAWQLYTWSADIWLLALAVLISMLLIRRDRVPGGVWLLLVAVQVTFIGAVGLIEGIGLLVGVSIAILVSIIAGQTLSAKAAGRASILGLVSGAAAVLLDLFGPAFRLPQPDPIRVFLPAILGVVILLYGVVTLRQFRNYSLRTQLLLGFLAVLILSSLVGVFSVQQQFKTAEQTAVTEASNVADTVSGIVTRNQVELQDLVTRLHVSQQRDVKVVDPNLRILADAIPKDIGTIFDADQNDEVAATLNDGQPRTFVEISANYPQGVKQVVVPVKDEQTGTIIGAVILDYTQALQQTLFAEADSFTKEVSATIANNPTGLQDFVNALYIARNRDIVVVGQQKQVLADSAPGNVGTIYKHDLRGEVAATLQDGQPRSFVEISVDHPSGVQQVITPLKDSAGNIIGATILGPGPDSGATAVAQAYNVAEAIGVAASQNQARLQEIINQLHVSQQRDVKVVDPNLRILADPSPGGVGTIFAADQNDEVAATLKDGRPRTFVEISANYPQGAKQVVVPVRDESGKIIAATILDYTPLYTEFLQTANTAVRTLVFLSLAGLLLAFVIGQLISASIANPISQLRDAALKIGSGQLDTPLPAVSSKNEIGVLAGTFKNMTAQLRGLIGSLEQRVAERTHDLELASEVGRAVSEKSADIFGLLKDAVELIRERFNLYYTQIYLADPAGRTLSVRAGTGEVGAELLRRGHHLAIGVGSLNGRAAAEKRAVIVADTKDSPSFLPNPLLPHTRSEMAIPLIVGGRVVGVLDMQSEQPGALNESNLSAFEVLAGQLAVALQNAALFTEVKEARSEVEAQVRRLTERGWQDFMDAIQRGQKMGFAFDQANVVPLREEALALMPAASALSVPISVTGAKVGTIQIANEPDRVWTAREVEILNAAAARLAQHIESLRLLAETERYRAQAEEAARRLTREGWETLQARGEIAPGYVYDLNEVKPLAEKGNGSPSAAFSQALVVRDETIGELKVDTPVEPNEASEIITAVAKQLSDHIEALRLLEATEYELAERTRAEQELLKVRLGMDRANDAVFITNTDGTIIYVNPAFERIYGWKPEEAIGKTPRIIKSGLIPQEQYKAFWNTLNSKKAVAGEIINKTKDGRLIPIEGNNNPIIDANGNIIGFLGLHRDISERKQAEEELRKRAAELQELDRLKTAFLANMSHELRTPLNSILGFTDVILEHLDGPLTDNMNNDLQLIQKNGQHLLNLINDVLDMAKIEAGRMNFTPEKFRVHDLLEEVVSITSPLANERVLALSIEANSDREVEVFADRTRIRQVMLNLVNNALKFTEKGKISICAARRDENVLIDVHDTGIGIPADKLEIIFQEFAQVDTSTTRRAGGTGLGLPISRRLIEMHGGRLWAESSGRPGEGSTFNVELPLEAKITELVEKSAK